MKYKRASGLAALASLSVLSCDSGPSEPIVTSGPNGEYSLTDFYIESEGTLITLAHLTEGSHVDMNFEEDNVSVEGVAWTEMYGLIFLLWGGQNANGNIDPLFCRGRYDLYTDRAEDNLRISFGDVICSNQWPEQLFWTYDEKNDLIYSGEEKSHQRIVFAKRK